MLIFDWLYIYYILHNLNDKISFTNIDENFSIFLNYMCEIPGVTLTHLGVYARVTVNYNVYTKYILVCLKYF